MKDQKLKAQKAWLVDPYTFEVSEVEVIPNVDWPGRYWLADKDDSVDEVYFSEVEALREALKEAQKALQEADEDLREAYLPE